MVFKMVCILIGIVIMAIEWDFFIDLDGFLFFFFSGIVTSNDFLE